MKEWRGRRKRQSTNTVHVDRDSSRVVGASGSGLRRCRSVRTTMVAQVLRVDERLAALAARVPALAAVRAAHVRLHVEVAGKRLAADGTDDPA